MEFCSGGNLDELIKNRSFKFNDQIILDWMIQLASGLNYLHSKKIIHRDIKTKNILLSNDFKTVKYTDFGLVLILKTMKQKSIVSNNLYGTLYYLAPEVEMEKKYKPMNDIWSLGVVFYQLVMRIPENDLEIEYLSSSIQKNPKYIKEKMTNKNPRFLFVCNACLQVDPKNRRSSVDLMEFLQLNEIDANKKINEDKPCKIQ